MSLLMDALRKAELQKQKLGGTGQAEHELSLSLEPFATPTDSLSSETPPRQEPLADTVGASSMSATRLPELPSRMEDLDEQFLSHAAQPAVRSPISAPPPVAEPAPSPRRETPAAPASAPTTSAAAHQPPSAPEATEAVRNLFEAKHPPPRNKRTFAIATGVLGFVAALGIGGYFWWEMQPKSTLLAGGSAIPAPPPPQPAPAVAPAPIAPSAPVQDSVSPASTIQVPPPSQAMSTPAADDEDEPAPKPVRPAARPTPASESAPAAPSPVRLSKAQVKADTTPEQAYQAFNRNEFDLARSLWQKILAGDPLNTDALHGMAALALRQQKPDEAAVNFRRVLDVNPKDAVALSALSSLRSPSDPQQAESQLKMQLVDQPDSPHLNFALGNLYARYERWPEAQQAYFKAHTSDTANPDYLVNLAISLDRLRQPRLAAQYYSRALAAAEQQPASFDPAQVAARLKILQASLLH